LDKNFDFNKSFFWGIYFIYENRDKKVINLEEVIFSNYDINSESPDLYVFGSSLTKFGLCEFNILDSILLRKNVNLNYKIVYKGSVILKDYDKYIAVLLKEKPRYIFIESNIVCLDMWSADILYSVSRFLRQYSLRLSRIPTYILMYNFKIFNLFHTPATLNEEVDVNENYWKLYNKRAKNFRSRTINDFPKWNAFFKLAKENNIQVIFLDFPRSKEAYKYLPKNLNEDLRELINEYQKTYNIDYLEFPYMLDQKTYFSDVAHLNKIGAKLYSEWFINEINKIKLKNNN
jgi:hypothetical protein